MDDHYGRFHTHRGKSVVCEHTLRLTELELATVHRIPSKVALVAAACALMLVACVLVWPS